MKSIIQQQIQHIDHIVGRNLKKYRIRFGFSQAEIAAVLGVSIQQIQKYEKGINRISSGKLYKITLVFGTPLKKFFK